MAAKKEPVKKESEKKPEAKKAVKKNDGLDLGGGRKATVQPEPETSFEERTGAGTPPWMKEDGAQDNGEVVESEPTIEGEAKE